MDGDAWKVFNRDTEAGRLLSKLYGVAAPEKVSYRQPLRRRSTAAIETTDDDEEGGAPTRSWKTTCVVHGTNKKAEEEKERERKENAERALSLAIPKVGRHPAADGASHGRKIDLVPRRKTEAVCRSTVEEAADKKRMYRPPRSREISSDDAKARLQRMMTGDPPSPVAPKSSVAKYDTVHPETIFDQLLSEINERRRHQLAMEAIGAGDDTRETTAFEIKERLEHLRRLDPQRALAEAQRLLEA
jgi:hypothetical protein